MSSRMSSLSTRMVFFLLGLLVVGSYAQLRQTYCSSQNTGSDSTPNFSVWMSNGACFDACKDQYAFAVVQYQNCWCSNFVPAEQESVGDCSEGCPGYDIESCGNRDRSLFGYVALSRAPSGTAGASQPSETSESRPTFTARPPAPSRTSSSAPPTSTEEPPSTTETLSSTSEPPPTTPTPTSTSSESSTSTTSSAQTEAETPTTSTRVVTVSGSIVTQTVTSTPRANPGLDTAQEMPQPRRSSTGLIVGAIVGSIAGLAFLLLAFLFLWRRRRNTKRMSTTSRLNRNASVLSKAGLLSSAQGGDAEKSMEEPRYGSQRASALFADAAEESPISAPGGVHDSSSSHLTRRDSRPLVYDQRLNPAALMENWQMNGSRTSIGTMQDQRDYSRPLNVVNPDPEDGRK